MVKQDLPSEFSMISPKLRGYKSYGTFPIFLHQYIQGCRVTRLRMQKVLIPSICLAISNSSGCSYKNIFQSGTFWERLVTLTRIAGVVTIWRIVICMILALIKCSSGGFLLSWRLTSSNSQLLLEHRQKNPAKAVSSSPTALFSIFPSIASLFFLFKSSLSSEPSTWTFWSEYFSDLLQCGMVDPVNCWRYISSGAG